MAALPLATVVTPAAAEDNQVFFGTLMEAIGLTEPNKPNIDYRERAPLVVPPAAHATGEALPAPRSRASTTLPNWPKDPDVTRAQQAAAKDSNEPVMRYEDKRDVLLPSELNKGRKANANRLDGPAQRYEDKRDIMSPSELGFTSWFGITKTDEKPMVFTGEPARESLTQPPVGYQTPAPNAPYGVVEKKNEPFKFPTLFDRQ
ncbi:hypothetical protein GCM10007301_56230 [Azorhizobium oxalatiphilum]|uniref:Uncharacterized protein n=2 Tax=Azorhizobium oxalatiphilum TaxID=980631 RepID=A0A917FL29_9HYPH|nr:hypothetical protein GCM10007301_56230 [Azorhizobium oxalatiphilum]